MATSKKVTRITATDDAPKKVKASAKATKAAKAASPAKVAKAIESSDGKRNVFARIGGYFKGAWLELRQVRWPNRKATWSLTLAVIIFSLFFVLLVVLLDTFFKFLFELIVA